jgi:hypothetical protein
MDPDPKEPTLQLIRDALDEGRELVRLEIALAREEVTAELRQARANAVVFAGAAVGSIAAITMFMVATALAFAMPWLAALIIAIVLLTIGGVLGLFAYKALPMKPLAQTQARIEADLAKLKETARDSC